MTPTLTPFAIYLRDHEAAAHGGVALFRRAARSQQGRPWGAEIATLRDEVRADLTSLRRLMRGWDVVPDLRLEAVMQVGELLGRAKPNGRLLRRSPLSDLMEVEAMLDAVFAKQRGWTALLAAGVRPPAEPAELETLSARAGDQQHRLQDIHRRAGEKVLGPSAPVT